MSQVMRVLDGHGDTKTAWPETNEVEADSKVSVEDARAQFDRLIAHNYAAFEVETPGKPGEKISHFREEANEILMVPPLAGG